MSMTSPRDPYNAVVNEVTAGPGGADKSAAQDAGAASIDKVRDILFGTQLREFDRRFARLEERMLKETNDLKEDLRARLDALELYARKENDSLADQIKAEHDGRVEAAAGLTRELQEAAQALERRSAALDEQLSKAQRELRQQILEQHQRLSDEIRKRADDLLAALARESRELRSDKADRTTLAALFNELAMRLTSDLGAAGAEDTRNG
jgi:hypothetical protein